MIKKLKVVTYNIQFSQHPNKVIGNLLSMVNSGASVLCLQEVFLNKKNNVVEQLIKRLGNSWEAVCHLGNEESILSMGNCIIWNKKVVSAKSKHCELLPYSERLTLHEKVFSFLAGGMTSPFKRRAVLMNFNINNKNFCIANIHLDHNGGTKNRLKQLVYIKKLLGKVSTSNKEIICGDFNCFDLSGNGAEIATYGKILGPKYIEATKKIEWTGDLYDIDTSKGIKLFGKLIKLLNIHVKKKVDFVWIKNLNLVDCHKLDSHGSDHQAVIVEITI